jgi:hypothetical protein
MGKWIGQILPGLAARGKVKPASDTELAKRTPALYELLTCVEVDGKERQTPTLLVFAEGGAWKCCIKDRESGHYAFMTSDTFMGVLCVVDAALQAGTVDWRAEDKKQWQRNGK